MKFRFPLAAAIGSSLLALVAADVQAQETRDGDAAMRSYLSANGLLGRGMYELAEKDYREFLSANADHPKALTAHYGLGICLFRQKKFEQAAKELAGPAAARQFEFASESRLVIAQCELAQAHFAQAASALDQLLRDAPEYTGAGDAASLLVETRYREGKPQAAIAACEELAKKWPKATGRARAETFAALAEMTQKDYPAALRRLESVLSDSPDPAVVGQATLLAAQCAQQTGDIDRAVARFQEVAKSKDARLVPDALFGLGCIQRQQGNLDEAAHTLDTLLDAEGDLAIRAPATIERGRVSFDKGEFDQARSFFTAASKVDSVDAAECQFWLAKCDLRSEDAGAAAARLTKAIEANPKSPLAAEMSYDRAIALLRAGDEAKAAAALREFLETFRKHSLAPDAMETLATILHRTGKYDESARLCTAFLSTYPDHVLAPSVQFLGAENLYLKGNLEGAAAAYEHFLADRAASPLAATASFRLGVVLFQLKQYDRARPLLEQASQSSEASFRPAVLCLGDLLFQRGDWSAAGALLERYVAFGKDAPSADDALLKLGLCLQHQDKPAEALTRFEQLLADFGESPHRTQAMFERGRSLLSLGKTEDATAAFKRIVNEDGQSRFGPLARSELGAIALRSGDYTGASKLFEQAASAATSDDTKSEAVFQQAQSMLAAGKYAQAASLLDSLAESKAAGARAAQARALSAIANARLKRDAGSLAKLELAAQPDSTLDDATRESLVYEQACCLRALDRSDDAAILLRTLVQTRGSAIAPYAALELAAVESDASRFKEASQILEKLRVTPQDLPPDVQAQSAYRLAYCLLKLEQPKEAITLLDQVLEGDTNASLTPAANLLAGECRFKLGRHAEAAPFFERAVATPSDDQSLASALLRLGECRAATQEWDASQTAFTTYLNRFKSGEFWFQARFGVGWAKENSGDFDGAIAAYRVVTDKHQGVTAARAQFQIGECLFAKKLYEDAARELLRVDILFAYPEWSAAALYEAGRCFESLSKADLAAEQFKQVKEKYPGTEWARLASERLSTPRAAAQPK